MKKQDIQFTKPYSKGQITIPLEFRKKLEIDENTWLLMTVEEDKIVIKPVKEEELAKQGEYPMKKKQMPEVDQGDYREMVVRDVKGSYGEKIDKENKEVRQEIEEKLKKLSL